MTPLQLTAHIGVLRAAGVRIGTLAAHLGIAPSTLTRYRDGSVSIPSDFEARLQAAEDAIKAEAAAASAAKIAANEREEAMLRAFVAAKIQDAPIRKLRAAARILSNSAL